MSEHQEQIHQLQAQLAERDATIAQLERRQRVDALLVEADTIDLDAARLLTEVTLQHMDDADVEAAITELRNDKPYLFSKAVEAQAKAQATPPTNAPTHGAQSPRTRPVSNAQENAAQAAAAATVSGNRDDLLHYLRLKRA